MDGLMEVSSSSPKASTFPPGPPGRQPDAPQPGQAAVCGQRLGGCDTPRVGGPTVTHPILATSRNPDSGLRAHAVPCPSLPASPTLSPALSTWHTWARGDWRHSPPLWGTKGRGRVGSRCHIPPPSLPSFLPPSHRCCPGLCPLLCPQLRQVVSLGHCGSVVDNTAHNPAATGCVLPAVQALGDSWYHSWLLPSTWSAVMGEVRVGVGDAPLPTCHLHCLPTGSCTTQLFPSALLTPEALYCPAGMGLFPFLPGLLLQTAPAWCLEPIQGHARVLQCRCP